MTEIRLSIDKAQVYDEVAKTAEYVGSKMKEDNLAYERISLTDENGEMLDRFWDESKALVEDGLKRMLKREDEEEGVYTLTLRLSDAFKESLVESMKRSLFSYFVMSIAAKWFIITNKEEAEGYAKAAAAQIEDVMRKAYYKKAPTRPTFD